ncbi:MAG: DUF2156 domain-containing protein [Desulfobacterales bacterium]|nr:MAG: DUF2156 domain-containing protein [Desulfobacterales bacterium]
MPFDFEPIRLERQTEYRRLFAACPQKASDYSFLNLWAWAAEYGLYWAWEDPLVWIKQTRPEVFLWAPVGPWEAIDWQARLGGDPSGRGTVFIRVPQKLAESWQSIFGKRAVVAEERGDWDYLYAVSDLIELKGSRFHKKKNLLNQFTKKYDYVYTELSPDLIARARAMQSDWCTWRDCESSAILAAENRAIARMLMHWEELTGLLGGALLVEGAMVAYTVAEGLTDDTLLIHFEKGDTDYKGAYQAINQMFLAHAGQKFSWVNREQDLGDENLRQAKLSYLPEDFLRKYRVTLPGPFEP